VQINFLIKFFLDSYSEKDSQLALRRYISSICIQAAKESLITDALEINGIIIDLFTKYFQIRFTKNITKIIYLEFHSILSEVCMIFERFLRNTSHEQINDLFCEYSPQLSSLLDKNKFKIDFIDENERNILEFYFCYRGMKNTQNKIDT
jgi:hypothetical protein